MNEQTFFKNCIKNKIFPKNDLQKQIILKYIVKKFRRNKIYKEQKVNEIIKEFYDDFSLIRRELINFGYMQRNPYKSEYWLLKYELSKEDLEKVKSLQNRTKEFR